MDRQLGALIEAADLNALLGAVDNLVAARDWDGLVELADACEDAVERGKQLWPIAAHVDYRLALDGPAEYAADVLESDHGRFVPGPLTEVAASTHTWEDLAAYISSAQAAAYVAQERVLRGEDLSGDDRAHPEVMGLPLSLQSFEPTYALATFHRAHVEVAEPWTPRAPFLPTEPRVATITEDAEVEAVFLDLVTPWVAESNGAARVAVVEGDAIAAASQVTYGPFVVADLEPVEAMQRIAWAAASGGAHGRRRGAAYGRFMAFYTVSVLGDLGWPAAPSDIGSVAAGLQWHAWEEDEAPEGWIFRLAVADPDAGWSVAINASDVIAPDESR